MFGKRAEPINQTPPPSVEDRMVAMENLPPPPSTSPPAASSPASSFAEPGGNSHGENGHGDKSYGDNSQGDDDFQPEQWRSDNGMLGGDNRPMADIQAAVDEIIGEEPESLAQALADGAVAVPGKAPDAPAASTNQSTTISPPKTQPPSPATKSGRTQPANDRASINRQTDDFQPSRAPDLSDRYIAARKIVFEDIRQGVDVTTLVRLDRDQDRQDIETAEETIINFRRLDLTAAAQYSLSRAV